MEHRFEIIRAIPKPFTFKAAHQTVSYGWIQRRSHSYTFYVFIIFAIKHKESFLVAMLGKS